MYTLNHCEKVIREFISSSWDGHSHFLSIFSSRPTEVIAEINIADWGYCRASGRGSCITEAMQALVLDMEKRGMVTSAS